MTNKIDTVKEFEQYAKDKLTNHIAELNTRYENRKIDKQILQQSYREHQEIYNKELDEKVQSLLSAESNSWLKGELENIKDTYLSKLNSKNQ